MGPTTTWSIVMSDRTTVIQYRNKTVTNIHTHDHEHVHLHGPGDRASLLIAAIVILGVVISVIVIVCLVSTQGGSGYKSKWET